MRLFIGTFALVLGTQAQAVEVYKCTLQQTKQSATSIGLKNKPDSKHKDYYVVDGKKVENVLEAVQAKMKDGLPKQTE